MNRPLPLLLAVLFLAARAVAQGAPPTFSGTSYEIPLASGIARTPFGRVLAANLDGDLAPDAVVVQEDPQAPARTGFVMIAPAELESMLALPTKANDLDVLAGLSPDGHDVIVGVGGGGLTFTWLDAASRTLVSSFPALGELAGGVLVRACDLDGGGGPDLIVVGEDGVTLHGLKNTGGTSFAPSFSFAASATVLDVVALEWDAQPGLELAVLTTAGVAVHDPALLPSTTPLFASASLGPSGAIASLGQADQTAERLVWITPSSTPGQQWMFAIDPAPAWEFVDFGALEAVAAATADYDGDGDDELLVPHRFSHETLQLTNQRSGDGSGVSFTGDLDQVLIFPTWPAGPAPDVSATPAYADLDLDQDVDVLFPRGDRVFFFHGETHDEGARTVSLDLSLGDPTFELETGEGQSTLHVNVALPVSTPFGASHVQVDVWRQPAWDQPFEDTLWGRVEVAVGELPVPVAIPIPEVELGFEAVYGIQLRALQKQGGVAVQRYPALTGYFNMEPEIVQDLEALPGGGATYTVELLGDSNPPGGFVTRPRVGPFTNGQSAGQ